MQAQAVETSAALTAAINALHEPHSDPHAHAHAARRVSRLADDAELAALEAGDPSHRAALLAEVAAARRAVTEARLSARQRALSDSRARLLPADDPASSTAAARAAAGAKLSSSSAAAELAADINTALRRATAVISDEVARSRAAGNVLDDGTKRLSATARQHQRFGSAMRAGGKTLRALRASELAANVAVVLSFAFFFFIAAQIASRRVSSSTLVTVAVKPGLTVARAPFAVARAAWTAAFRKNSGPRKVPQGRNAGVEAGTSDRVKQEADAQIPESRTDGAAADEGSAVRADADEKQGDRTQAPRAEL